MQAESHIEIQSPRDRCAMCDGTGYALVTGKIEAVRPCDCVRVRKIELALERSGIPERFRACSFDNYATGTMALSRALQVSKRFVEESPADDVGLLYLGNCGVGKTHLSCAVLTLLIRKGLSGLFYDFRDLLKAIQDSYNHKTNSTELQILAPVFSADVLVLDELGASKPTEWVQETMTHIINTRYNEKRTTIFTSNYLDVPVGSYSETLTERVGVRLRSRLHEMCRLVPMEGEDYRAKARNRR